MTGILTAPPLAMLVGPDQAVRAVVAHSAQDLAPLRDDWQALRRAAGALTADADPEFLLETLPGMSGPATPHVAVFYRGQSPCGLIAGRVTRRPLTRTLGYARVRLPRLRTLSVVYGGLLTDGAADTQQAIVDHLRGMLRSGHVDHLAVDFLRLDHPLYASLAGAAGRVAPPVQHWRLALRPGDAEATLSCLSGKHRYTLRRADRLLSAQAGGDLRLRVLSRPEEMDAFVTCAAALNAQTYQGGLGVGFADTPLWRCVLASESRHGRARCYLLQAGDRPIAFQVGGVHGNTFLLSATSFLPEFSRFSPGSVLMVRVIRALCQEGVSGIDFGFGDADYKRMFGTERWQESSLEFYGRTWRAMVPRAFDATVGRCAAWGLRAASATGATGVVKRLWRARAAARQAQARSGDSAPVSPADSPPSPSPTSTADSSTAPCRD